MPNYDEDYNDPRQRCPHGTFIGSWWGPDYLCGYCEDGVTVKEYEAMRAWQSVYQLKAQLEKNTAILAQSLMRKSVEMVRRRGHTPAGLIIRIIPIQLAALDELLELQASYRYAVAEALKREAA